MNDQEKKNRKNGQEAVMNLPGKYLTFELNREFYGIPILKVREIIGLLPITRVPRTPEFTMGVINLRGKVIPVIDLRRKFGMPEAEPTEETCIIVVDVEEIIIGVLVDRVSEVLDVDLEQLEPTPNFGASINPGFITAMAKTQDQVYMLLDIELVLTTEEMVQLQGVRDTNGESGV
jgi:purine-binding chemotaxis protein CheW